jgi:nicotinamidase-related amidase
MTRALLVIDVQESFRQRENWQVVSNPQIVERVNALVATARTAQTLVVWVLHAEPGTDGVFDPGKGFVRPIDGLRVDPGDPVLTKTAHNAFTTTGLAQLLTTHGVREVWVAGIRTEQCCETTARLASDLGYEVVFVTDATATFPIPHWDAPEGRTLAEELADPRTLPAADVIARTEYALAGRFATIATVAELTG